MVQVPQSVASKLFFRMSSLPPTLLKASFLKGPHRDRGHRSKGHQLVQHRRGSALLALGAGDLAARRI